MSARRRSPETVTETSTADASVSTSGSPSPDAVRETPTTDAGSPLSRQYERIKAKFPDGILLFRLGDFYETFADDAVAVARDLEIALTSKELGKGNRVPLAGVPVHSLEANLAKLLAKGHRVAICEQFGDPRATKGILERDIVRVVTPGTVLEPDLLPGSANNFLAAAFTHQDQAGLAYVDITTSEFVTLQIPAEDLSAELRRLSPAELLVPNDDDHSTLSMPATTSLTPLDSDLFDPSDARQRLLQHFGASTLDAYGCERLPLAIAAAGAVLAYLQDTQRGALAQVQSLATQTLERTMRLDPQTVRTLELFESSATGARQGSLLGLLDLTQTPMGARLLRRWIGQPLLDLDEIHARHDAVDWLLESGARRSRISAVLHRIPDLERLVNRARSGVAFPRDVVNLRRGLEALSDLRDALSEAIVQAHPLAWALDDVRPHTETAELIAHAIADEPPPTLGDGDVVRQGFSQELDDFRATSRNARDLIAKMESDERERTGIPSLKVGYSRVFGYYMEVTRTHLARVPEDYVRKQTVSNGERFFTPALKEQEERISHAQERAAELESAIFRQVCSQVGDEGEAILSTARAIARLDTLAAFTEVASRHRHVRPHLDDSTDLEILEGRHPVVETYLQEPFVPNDTHLPENVPIGIITGPNMAGKSTYLRQVALVALLAQIGAFVPAQSAHIGLVDRIFTRAGLQDDISTGRSTFMVEMTETAYILNQASHRSLIVLDEIGRGTSTYDGLAIAWAVVEHIHNHARLGTRTLFATHYHELVELGESLPKAANFHVAVSDEEGKVVFLRRVLPGGADRSYGVHVAQLAGLPRDVIGRAQEVLTRLEEDAESPPTSPVGQPQQPALFSLATPSMPPPSRAEEELRRLTPDQMTPLEALAKLYDLKRSVDNDDNPD